MKTVPYFFIAGVLAAEYTSKHLPLRLRRRMTSVTTIFTGDMLSMTAPTSSGSFSAAALSCFMLLHFEMVIYVRVTSCVATSGKLISFLYARIIF